MSTADISNLFSAAERRERVVDWQAPRPVAKAAAAMSGLEAMCGIRDGILPPPPMARLIGFRLRIAEPALRGIRGSYAEQVQAHSGQQVEDPDQAQRYGCGDCGQG